MTPSQSILQASVKTDAIVDKRGRKIVVRRPTALDTLRLFKAAGPVLAQNEPWLSMAVLAFSVLEIDGIPIPVPSNESQIENMIDRLGDDGIAAVAEIVNAVDDHEMTVTQMGNSHSIPF